MMKRRCDKDAINERFEASLPQFSRQSRDWLPGNQPLDRGNLELNLIDPMFSCGHQFSPSRTVPYFLVSF